MSDCICVRSEWNAERTHIVNSFERDSACPIHGDDSRPIEVRIVGTAGNRWAAFTTVELQALRGGQRNIVAGLDEELEARAAQRTEPA